jgi:hypothetical protein
MNRNGNPNKEVEKMKRTTVNAILCGFLFLAVGSSCRIVKNETVNNNRFSAGEYITLKGSGQDTKADGTQAADKELGDISPATKITPIN